jgi:hypothetical protein
MLSANTIYKGSSIRWSYSISNSPQHRKTLYVNFIQLFGMDSIMDPATVRTFNEDIILKILLIMDLFKFRFIWKLIHLEIFSHYVF